MKLRKLITTKPHKYGTRHMVAGDEYEVPPRHAIALVAGKKARFADDKPVRAAKMNHLLVPDSDDSIAGHDFVEYMQPQTIVGHIGGNEEERPDIDSLRLQATQLGINVDGRWGLARLQYEISKAKG